MKSRWCFFGRNELFGLTPWLLEGLKAVESSYTKTPRRPSRFWQIVSNGGEENAPEKLRFAPVFVGLEKNDSQILERSRDKTYKTEKKFTLLFFLGLFLFLNPSWQRAKCLFIHHSRNSYLGCRTTPNLHPEGDRGEGLAFFFFGKKKTSRNLETGIRSHQFFFAEVSTMFLNFQGSSDYRWIRA